MCSDERKSREYKEIWKKNYTRKDRGRPLANKLLCLISLSLCRASFICLDSVSKTLFWLRCLVVCCCLPSIHLLQWPHNLTIYSPFPPIFSLNYLFPIFDYSPPPPPPHTHTGKCPHSCAHINFLIHHQSPVKFLSVLQETGEFKVQGKHHAKSLIGYFANIPFEKIFGGCLFWTID